MNILNFTNHLIHFKIPYFNKLMRPVQYYLDFNLFVICVSILTIIPLYFTKLIKLNQVVSKILKKVQLIVALLFFRYYL